MHFRWCVHVCMCIEGCRGMNGGEQLKWNFIPIDWWKAPCYHTRGVLCMFWFWISECNKFQIHNFKFTINVFICELMIIHILIHRLVRFCTLNCVQRKKNRYIHRRINIEIIFIRFSGFSVRLSKFNRTILMRIITNGLTFFWYYFFSLVATNSKTTPKHIHIHHM